MTSENSFVFLHFCFYFLPVSFITFCNKINVYFILVVDQIKCLLLLLLDLCTRVEVLDLTHDLSCPFKLQFDDTRWSEHLGSLKPIGLAILLNTCNMATQEHYVQFCSHVTCEALYNEDLVPVTNRR